MKKLIAFFAIAAVAVMAGCRGMEDKECQWDFLIQNQTGSNVTIIWNGVARPPIISGEEQVISYTIGSCPVNRDPPRDLFQEDEIMHNIYYRPDVVIQIQADEELMPEIIFRRKYWSFTTTSSSTATYTLVLTDELIETLLSENNPNN